MKLFRFITLLLAVGGALLAGCAIRGFHLDSADLYTKPENVPGLVK